MPYLNFFDSLVSNYYTKLNLSSEKGMTQPGTNKLSSQEAHMEEYR
jgi:hypothetical protein